MAVHVYKSTDDDAPKLSGESGKLVELLETCLVTGYGSKAGAGWSIEKDPVSFHKAFFQPTDPAATGCGLYLDDTGPGDFGFQHALGQGVEPAAWDGFDGSGAPVFTGARFPVAPNVTGGWWAKSRDQDSDPVPWILVADERLFYLFTDPYYQWPGQAGDLPGQAGGVAHAFGDLVSFVPGDAYACVHSADSATAGGTSFQGQGAEIAGVYALFGDDEGAINRAYLARAADQVTQSEAGEGGAIGQTMPGLGGEAYPVAGTVGSAIVHPIYWRSAAGRTRGALPGAYSAYHDNPFNHEDVHTLADGRDLLVVEIPRDRENDPPAQVMIDVTGPWR